MLRRVLITVCILNAVSSARSAENNSGSFLRKGQKINLIGPEESLVHSWPLDGKRLRDWTFEGKEEEGAVIAVVELNRFAGWRWV